MRYELGLSCLMFFYLGCQSGATDHTENEPEGSKPNVVLIMADDLGYADLSSYGSTSIQTPHIDQLARQGMKLTNYHSNGVVCSPTRASLMTGLYPQEVGIEGVITAKSHRDTGMSPDQYTLAELFKAAGYRTALFGKWHLGYKPALGPVVQGFDVFRGFVSGNIDYQSHIDQEGYADWWKGKELHPEKGYLTSLITDHGIRFMENTPDRPFFLYLPHGAPHSPYQGPNDPAERTVQGEFPISGSRTDVAQAYQEMVESLDANVGRIMAYLNDHGLLENTLVIFCSDNGASPKAGANTPFRGFKGQVYEGGHRVPAIFYWKGKVQPGTTDQLVLSMDMFPTLADLCHLAASNTKKVSGQSIAELLSNKPLKQLNERTVFWRFHDQKAARRGPWKLVIEDDEYYLYNLDTDQVESTDVKEEHSEIFNMLKQALQSWEAGLTEEIKA
uniref:Sulfatase-like hydrolase/transferase n=1 Tax=Roseihalotalea indica TaxID=2867963 RepID=A0AA49GMY9_9BACT|nr:sulfatase-like hydrolase/transferase [Tunicatimonas sp. TK19036]